MVVYKEKVHNADVIDIYDKQPSVDIDVYLTLLIDDLKSLWDRVGCYDSLKIENFTLRSILLWTINEIPAYGNLSGHNVEGYKAWSICSENIHAVRLRNCRNKAYMGHRWFLDPNHVYHKYTNIFNGE